MRAFASFEKMPIKDIQRAICQEALSNLFNEGFLMHPAEPEAGAKVVKAMLHQRYDSHLAESNGRY